MSDYLSPITFVSHKPLFGAILLPLLLALFLSIAAYQYGTPGFKVDKTQQGLYISQITNSKINAVQKGDLIIAVNKIPFNRTLGQLFLQEDVGSINTITLLRKNKPHSLVLKKSPFTPVSFILLVWPHFLLITVFLTLATVALINAPPSSTTRLFFLMLCGFSTAVASTLASHTGIMNPILISISFVSLALSNWLAFGAWIHFACRFPDERDLLKNHPRASLMFYLIPPTVAITAAIVASGMTQDFWPWLQRFRNLFLPVIILATFTKHTVDIFKLPPHLARNQIKLPVAAYWLSFGPYLFFYLLPNLFIDKPFIHFQTVILTFLFLPIAYFIALLRYRLFQVDRLISKTLSYFIIIGLISILYSTFIVFLKRYLWQNQVLSENVFLLFLIIIVTFFNPLASRLQHLLDRLIFRNRPPSSILLHNLSRSINSALDIPELIQAVTHDLPAQLHIRQIAMLPLDGTKRLHHQKQSILNPEKWENSELVQILQNSNNYYHCHFVSSNSHLAKDLAEIRKSGYIMVFGLRGNSSLIGLLFIGPKINGRLFTNEDILFFSTIANHTGIALENSLRYASLSESKKQLEELFKKLVQQKKMADLGEMATVLSHELKNPLAVIRSSAQHLKKGSHVPEIKNEMLDFILEEVDSLNLTVSSLLQHARHRPPDFQEIDLQESIPPLICKWQLSTNHSPAVQISCDIPSQLRSIQADKSQLWQILLNLIRNSEEAMEGKGEIILSIRENKDFVVIKITDTGPGIPREIQKDIFKSFFSTKKRGLGLGLPTCKQLLQSLNGTITFTSGQPRGTQATIHLPFARFP